MASRYCASLIVFAVVLFSSVLSALSSSIIQLPFDKSSDFCGDLSRPSSCPVNCFRADPVCGADGVTYWCGCADASCAGVPVVKSGYCEVGNGGSVSFPGQALLLVHIVWLIILGVSVLFGFF